MNCYNCDTVAEPGQKFCETCGARIHSHRDSAQHAAGGDMPPPFRGSRGGPAGPAAEAANGRAGSAGPGNGQAATGRAVMSPPPTLRGSPIRLGDGEQVIREYRAVQLRTQKRGEGTLYVTDARIVFYARAQGRGAQRASALVQQTRLEDVSGLQAFVSRRTSMMLILFTVSMSLLALGTLVSLLLPAFIVFFFLAGLGCLAIFGGAAERGRAGVKIHAREEAVSAIGFGSFDNQRSGLESLLKLLIFPLLVFLRAQTAFDVLLGRPGRDSDRLIAELGALILDLQTRGKLAADYWAGAPADGAAVRSPAG